MPVLSRARPTPSEALEIIRAMRVNPLLFTREVLGHDYWTIPSAIMQAIAQPHARVGVKSCHASGKTFTAGDAVLWWTCTGGIAVTTAPTWTQVKKLLWGAIHTAHGSARFPLGGTLNQTELTIGDGVYAMGLSTNEGVRFQGWHGRVLIVLDEAPGVKPEIWDAIEGIRAGGDVRVLALGNPIIASGQFFDLFGTHLAGWQTFSISAFDTPNLAGLTLEQLLALPEHELDVSVRPYLISRRYVVEKYSEWGPEHPLWQSKVAATFPRQSEDSLYSLAWLEAARVREAVDTGEPVTVGIDVAGPGEDETALAIRQGANVLAQCAWGQADPRGEVLATLAPWKARIEAVNIDVVGIGYYLAKHIADAGYPVVGINVGAAPTDAEKYANLKAEIYWGFRLRLAAGQVAGLTDERTIAQLVSVRYQHNARGQIVIESKDAARKRGVKSPDRAEALLLAFAPRLSSSAPESEPQASRWTGAPAGDEDDEAGWSGRGW